jgi:hypothetical protein
MAETNTSDISELAKLLEPHGLVMLAVLDGTGIEGLPAPGNESKTRQLLLVGNAGSSVWPAFTESPEYGDDLPDSLDRWSRRIAEQIAGRIGGTAIFPWEGPPYPPFLAWAGLGERVFSSPLSMFIHSEYGLWHAYRFALVLPGRHAGPEGVQSSASPCLSCTSQPCLDACPVDAFDGKTYAVHQCIDFLQADPHSACRQQGCGARRACPVGKSFTYLPDHARFHMDAFVKSTMLTGLRESDRE